MAHVDLVPRELDLSAYGHDAIVDKFNVVPGLRTSTAFFTFLRANLVVNPSAMSTPNLEPTTSQTLPPPSPSPLVTLENTPNGDVGPVPDDLPPLSVGIVHSRADKVDALELVADSIAQQRQTSSLHLVFHPYLLPVLAGALALAYQYSWRARQDLGLVLMLFSGVVMIYLLSIRFVTGRYVRIAESLQYSWLQSGSSLPDEDTVVAVRFGSDLIGALVLRLEPNPAYSSSSLTANVGSGTSHHGHGRRRSRHSILRGGQGLIRAWTVRLKYRGQGVGADMLHEAVRITREKCGRDAQVGFACEHANSSPVLPEALNGRLRKDERRAAQALDNVLKEWEGSKRRRRT